MKRVLFIFLILFFKPEMVAFAESDSMKVYALLDHAKVCTDSTNYADGKKYANDAIKLATKIKLEHALMDAYHELGRIEYFSANYPVSIDNYFKSLKLALKLKNKQQESNSLGAIGLVYYALEDFPKAIQYLNSSVSKSTDSANIADSYTYLAGVYFNLNKYDSAQIFYENALGIYTKINSSYNVIMCQQNMAGVYSRLGKKDKAIEIAEQSLVTSLKTEDAEQISYAYFTIAFVASENELYSKAITNFSKALIEYKKLNDLAYISNCHKGLSDCYYANGDSKNALEHYITYITIRDSTLNVEQAKEVTRKEVLFQVEKKQLADSIIQSEKANNLKLINDEKIKRQTIYTYSGIAGFALMLVLALVLFRSNRNKQKANELIAQQKSEVEIQKDIIEEKQKEIIDSINYAKRIQKSLLPTEKYIDKSLNRLKK